VTSCHDPNHSHPHDHPIVGPEDVLLQPRWRRVLGWALVLNLLMFVIEFISARKAASMSLQADSLDFLGDSFNYAMSLWVASESLRHRAKVSFLKGLSMGALGLFVLFETLKRVSEGGVPHSQTMGMIGALAFAVNFFVAILLYRFRNGDSNMQSVWLCTRNDAIGNFLVILSGGVVHFTSSGWPDWGTGLILAILGLQSGIRVMRLSVLEMRQ
jgi:Co/Zn/Cd efflux system component